MSGGLVSFGGYAFGYLQEYSDNFGDTVPTTNRLPGLSGGWNEDGIGAAPSAIGKITMAFVLESDTREAMDAKRKAVMRLVEYGETQLIYQPTDPNDPVMFCWARLNNASMSQRKQDHTDLRQRAQLIFQVAEPFWYSGGYNSVQFDDGYQFDDGLQFGDGALVIDASGASTSQTVTNNGNATAVCRVTISPDGADTCQNPTIQRIKDGVIVDEAKWTGTLTDADELTFDGKKYSIKKNGVSVFANATYKFPEFLRLEPGENTVRIKFNNGGDAAKAYLTFYDTWR